MSTNTKLYLAIIGLAIILFLGFRTMSKTDMGTALISNLWQYYTPTPTVTVTQTPTETPVDTATPTPTETVTETPTPTETCPEEQCPTPTPTDTPNGCDGDCETSTPTPVVTDSGNSDGSSGGGGGSIPKCSERWLTLVHPNDPDCGSSTSTSTPLPTVPPGSWLNPTPTPTSLIQRAGQVETGTSTWVIALVVAGVVTSLWYVMKYK